MADSRILHRAAGDSEKVAALSDLEYRVWTQYLLSADDFGVMPASAFNIQADNRNMRQRPTKAIQKALEAVIASGLVSTFDHQGERYIWQPDWNKHQGLRHPRLTVRPIPAEYGDACSETAKLIEHHPTRKTKDSRKVSETIQALAGADTRETQTLTPPQAPARTPTQGEKDRAERQKYGPPLVGAPTAHRGHGWCNDRGVCVPSGLHAELLQRLGGQHKLGELRAWMGSVVDALGDKPVTDDIFDFWRNQFAAWIAPVTTKPSATKDTLGVKLAKVGADYLRGEGITPPSRPLRQIVGGE